MNRTHGKPGVGSRPESSFPARRGNNSRSSGNKPVNRDRGEDKSSTEAAPCFATAREGDRVPTEAAPCFATVRKECVGKPCQLRRHKNRGGPASTEIRGGKNRIRTGQREVESGRDNRSASTPGRKRRNERRHKEGTGALFSDRERNGETERRRGGIRATRKDGEPERGQTPVQARIRIRKTADAEERPRFKCRVCNNHLT